MLISDWSSDVCSSDLKKLTAVRIDRARAMIVSAGSDDTSILITLTARHLAHDIPISVTVRNSDNELLARQAGATRPEERRVGKEGVRTCRYRWSPEH